MNTFSVGKCYNFGKMIPGEYNKPWVSFALEDKWIDFVERHQLTEIQISYIKKGFLGLPMIDAVEGNLFPFGSHKGKTFEHVPEKYWDWLSKQEWLDKWPSVKSHCLKRDKEKKESVLSADEVASILQKIQ